MLEENGKGKGAFNDDYIRMKFYLFKTMRF